jgi:hypothetical protein
MTKKRFTVIDMEEPRKQSVAEKGIPCTARHCCTRLNRLTEENERLNVSRDELINENRHIKNTIQTMLINERTRLGKSVLKQLWEAIQ